MLWFADEGATSATANGCSPPLMVFLSWMMFSSFRYPSFKAINWRTTRSLPKFVTIVGVAIMTYLYYEWMPAVIFVAYLLYGFLRPFLTRRMKEEIEEEVEDEEPAESPESP